MSSNTGTPGLCRARRWRPQPQLRIFGCQAPPIKLVSPAGIRGQPVVIVFYRLIGALWRDQTARTTRLMPEFHRFECGVARHFSRRPWCHLALGMT